jgi:thymidylate synthase
LRQYLDLLAKIRAEGEDVQSGAVLKSEGRKPVCRFLLGQQLRFDLREGFPAVTTKKLLFDWVVDEVLWFLRGETNVGTLGRTEVNEGVFAKEYNPGTRSMSFTRFLRRPIWDQWAKPDGDVSWCYGRAWRRWEYPVESITEEGSPSVRVDEWDQVAGVLADLKAMAADPALRARRRIMLSAWDPPHIKDMGLPPCHTLSQWLPTNGHLDVHCTCRSIDMFTGAPFNCAQYALLAHIFGGLAGLIPRELVLTIVDCHLYDNQAEAVDEQLTREPYPAPILTIDPRFWAAAPNLAVDELKRVDHAWFALDGYRHHRGKPGGRVPEIAV